MSDKPENLPQDIDAGLADLTTEMTAGDLLKKQGQKGKVKTMKEKDLKAFIAKALQQVMSASEHLSDEERQKILDDAETKMREAMAKVAKAEKDKAAAEAKRAEEAKQAEELKANLDHLVAQGAGASDELKRKIQELSDQNTALRQQLQQAQEDRDAAVADAQVLDEQNSNTRNILATTIKERDQAKQASLEFFRHTSALAELVLNLDRDYYGGKHQQANPADQEADGNAAFFHDFAVGAQIISTLSADLERLRSISAKEAESGQQPKLLEQDLQLLEQLKAGSLKAVDVAEPVAGLVEALEGARSEAELAQRSLAGHAPVPLTAVPEEGGEPATVIAGSIRIVRELGAVLAAARKQAEKAASATADKEKSNATLRDHILRSSTLVEAVLDLDKLYYGSKHQEAHPADENADGSEAFFHDFATSAAVIATLASDLERLNGYMRAEDEASHNPDQNLMEQNLALIEQIKAGSLKAVDMAEPVAGLVEALEGARAEAAKLGAQAGDSKPLTAVPDADGEAPAVIAGATQVVRELASLLARERARSEKMAAEVANTARLQDSFRTNATRSAALVQKVLALDDVFYDGRHQKEHPATDGADGLAQFYQDFAVGDTVLATVEADLKRLRADAAQAGQTVQAQAAALDQALAAIAERAGAEKIEAPAALADRAAAPATRVAAAREVLAGLGAAGISSQAASELSEALVVLIGEDEPVAAPAVADDREAVLAQLKAQIGRLGESFQKSQDDLTASRQREAELAAQVVALGERLRPLLAAGDGAAPAEPTARLAELQAAIAAPAADRPLAGAIASLVDALGERAQAKLDEDRAIEAAQQARLRSLAQDLVQAAQADHALAGHEATGRLAAVVQAAETPPPAGAQMQMADPVEMLDYSRRVIAAMAERIRAANADLTSIRAEMQAQQGRLQQGGAEAENLRVRLAQVQAATAAAEGRASALERDLEAVRAHVETDRSELAGMGAELLAFARSDSQIGEDEAVLDLAVATDQAEAKPHDLAEAQRRVLGVISQRRQTLLDEAADLRTRLAEASIAAEQTARQAAELAAAQARIKALDEDKAALEASLADKDEYLLSGKEVIGTLNEKNQKLTAERDELRAAVEKHRLARETGEQRRIKAETALFGLAEALSQAARSAAALPADGPDPEKARVDLEVALSELPDDSAGDVPVRVDLADDLLQAGSQVVEAIAGRAAALAQAAVHERDAAAAARTEATRAATEAHEKARAEGERAATLAKVEARLQAAQDENQRLVADLARSASDLTRTRSDLAAIQVDLGDLRGQLEARERRLAELAGETERANALETRLARSEQRLATAQESERKLAEAIANLAEETGQTAGEFKVAPKKETARFSRTFKRLEAAVEEGADAPAEDLIATSQAVIEQVQGQCQAIGDEARRARDELIRLRHETDELRARISQSEAILADRDLRLGKTEADLAAKAKEIEEAAVQAAKLKAENGKMLALLREVSADRDELKAREGSRSQMGGAALADLEKELDSERSAREDAERRLIETKAAAEASEAGLKAENDALARSLGERDQKISALTAALDDKGGEGIAVAGLKDEISALKAELAQERSRRRELEDAVGHKTGGMTRQEALRTELKEAQRQRDDYQASLGRLDAQIADLKGELQATKASLEARAKEQSLVEERRRTELAREKSEKSKLLDEVRSLKEQNAGLQARNRALTGGA